MALKKKSLKEEAEDRKKEVDKKIAENLRRTSRVAEGGSDELRGSNKKGQLRAIGAKDDGTWKDIKGE